MEISSPTQLNTDNMLLSYDYDNDNLTLLQGKSVQFASVIYEFDLNQAYLLQVMGYFGGDYMRFGHCFSAHGVSSEGTSNPDTLISWPKRKGIYIISYRLRGSVLAESTLLL